MSVTIGEIDTEVNAFDPSALLSDEVLRILVARVAEELGRAEREDALRGRDAELNGTRRAVD